MYGDGLGVQQSHKLAIKWLRKAADQGHEEAKSVYEKYEKSASD